MPPVHPSYRGASAPGKLMIAGEYAVLDGAPAVVTAVSARAQAVWSGRPGDGSSHQDDGSRKSRPPGPEALLARRCAEQVRGVVPQELEIDVSALRSTDRKLGLGSSAAAAAAAAGAVWAYHGRDPAAERRAILEAALEGHRAVAPEGSGADVAAAVLGGTLRFSRQPGSPEVSVSALEWPPGLALRVVWTGQEARTSDLVARVNQLTLGERRRRLDAIAEAAQAFIDAFQQGRRSAALDAVGAHHRAMADLGRAAGAPIVEERLEAAATLAAQHGGAAKPSGAGGGDVALAFFATPDDASQFDEAAAGEDMAILGIEAGAEGVRGLAEANDARQQDDDDDDDAGQG